MCTARVCPAGRGAAQPESPGRGSPRLSGMPTVKLCLAQDPAADKLLSKDPLALLIGMVLDQQIPLEKAFSSPAVLAQRLGRPLDAADIAAMDPDELAGHFKAVPALHRFPGSMAAR